MSDLTKGKPEFTTAIRGYDRLQVDDYIERLHSLVAYAEQRTREAEAGLEFNHHASVGPRVSEILDLAVEESKELRERIVTKARCEAQEIVESAHAQAAAARDESQRERRNLVGNLRQLQEALGAAVNLIPDQPGTQTEEFAAYQATEAPRFRPTEDRDLSPFGAESGLQYSAQAS
jgi:cell division septum initiation protein DivIVA